MANALVNRGFSLGKLGRDYEAIVLFNTVISQYREASSAFLRETAAKAEEFKKLVQEH